MIFLQTIAVAFSMFSAIPVYQFDWNEKNMKYALCAFPLVGIPIGVALLAWIEISAYFNIGTCFFASIFTVIPMVITGGIHLDGFCDTFDGLASHADIEKKLEILSDSNSGAFAIISLVCYILIYFGTVSEIRFAGNLYIPIVLGFMLSRSLSGFAIAVFKCAKNSGLVHSFADMAAKKKVRTILAFFIIAISSVIIITGGAVGTGMVISQLLMFIIYYKTAMKNFGGITGDLAGWFLQLAELLMLLAIVAVQKIQAVGIWF